MRGSHNKSIFKIIFTRGAFGKNMARVEGREEYIGRSIYMECRDRGKREWCRKEGRGKGERRKHRAKYIYGMQGKGEEGVV